MKLDTAWYEGLPAEGRKSMDRWLAANELRHVFMIEPQDDGTVVLHEWALDDTGSRFLDGDDRRQAKKAPPRTIRPTVLLPPFALEAAAVPA